MVRRVSAMILGVGAALQPLLAIAEGEKKAAAEVVSRATGVSGDVGTVALVTVGALLGLFAVAGVGFLYRRERRLDWTFQRPDAPHDEHH